jgi:hypothetical protein
VKLKELVIACLLTLPFVAFSTEINADTNQSKPTKPAVEQAADKGKTLTVKSPFKFKPVGARCEPFPKCK